MADEYSSVGSYEHAEVSRGRRWLLGRKVLSPQAVVGQKLMSDPMMIVAAVASEFKISVKENPVERANLGMELAQ